MSNEHRPWAPPPDRARAYSTLGAVLGLGAPLGFLALGRILSRWPFSAAQPGRSPDARALAYMSLTTPVAFGLFGLTLGNREQRLREAAAELQRLREEFAAVVAHDLRNPIQAILLELELLTESAREGEVCVPLVSLDRLRRNSERLTHMVNDLLDASRIEASRLQILPEPLFAADAVSSLVDRIRPTLGKHALEVDADTDGEVPQIMADPHRLDQILTNLLDNARKYSPPESLITVLVRKRGAGVTIAVKDRGQGIAPEELPRLFDRFYQSKRARAMKSGLGLGLYITKGLVEAHRGHIDVQSEPGKGSTFSVWFPQAEPAGMVQASRATGSSPFRSGGSVHVS